MKRLVFAVLALLFTSPALAYDAEWCRMHNVGCDDGPRIYKPTYRITVHHKQSAQERRAERREELRREERREERREATFVEERRECLGIRRAIGEEAISQEKAIAAADRAWETAVSYDHGRRYMDLLNARNVLHTCSRGQPEGVGVVKRLATKAGAYATVCTTEAQPCKPVPKAEDR